MATRLSPTCLQVVELQDTSTAQELMEGMLGGPAVWFSLLQARTCCWHRLTACIEPQRLTHTQISSLPSPLRACAGMSLMHPQVVQVSCHGKACPACPAHTPGLCLPCMWRLHALKHTFLQVFQYSVYSNEVSCCCIHTSNSLHANH